MIIKGGSRGGAGNLAAHLEKDTNERVSVVSIDGLAATDIRGALKEIMAMTVGTECRSGMYHASISAAPGEAEMTPEQRARAVDILADELGLTGQPRIVVEHVKVGESGIERTHQHVVFSRVDEDGKTVTDFRNFPAHERAARAIEMELDHQRTPGAWDRQEGAPRPNRTPGHDEYQQAERSKLDPREAAATLTTLWQQSDSGRAFVEAAAEQGFAIVRGDKCLLVMDEAGDHVRLSRRLPDRAADIAERMSEVREFLPTLDEAEAALDRTAHAPAVEAALQAHDATEGMEVAADVADPSLALPEAPLEAVPDLWEDRLQEVEPEFGDAEVRSIADSQEDKAWQSGYVDVSSSNVSRDKGNGGDAFRDEKPTLAGPAGDSADSLAKGLGVVVAVIGKSLEGAAELAGDLAEGLLGLFTGGGAEPAKPAATSQVQPPPAHKTPPPPRTEIAPTVQPRAYAPVNAFYRTPAAPPAPRSVTEFYKGMSQPNPTPPPEQQKPAQQRAAPESPPEPPGHGYGTQFYGANRSAEEIARVDDQIQLAQLRRQQERDRGFER